MSVSWLDYYRNNRESLLAVPWERGAEITGSEREAIWNSVREFQLGESSEGRHIIRCAHEFAARQQTPAYAEAIKLFIREEQRHARDLGRFMDLAGIPRRTRAWPDTVFRCLRHLSGIEVSISVLITAEIIAKVYYAALREATGSTVLRCLCDQILRDERQHVRFQCDYLAILRGGPPAVVVRPDRGNAPLSVLRRLPRCLEKPRPGNPKRRNAIQPLLEELLARDE